MSELLLQEQTPETTLEMRETTVGELAAMATQTAFEELASTPQQPAERAPLMTDTTWDDAAKKRDYNDPNVGII